MMIFPKNIFLATLMKGIVPATVAAVVAAIIATAAYPFILIFAFCLAIVFKTFPRTEIFKECWREPFVLIWTNLTGFLAGPWRGKGDQKGNE